MSTLINMILLVALGFAAFFIVKRMRGHQKPEHVVPKDPKSQAIYNEVKHKDEEKITLTLQEKIELSWQFLTNITEQVMNRFSSADKDKIHQAGERFNKNGMKYQHDVHQEAHITQEAVKARVMQQNKSKDQSRLR